MTSIDIYMNLLLKIITRMSSSVQDDETETLDKEFNALVQDAPSRQNLLNKVSNLIFSHEEIKEYFLECQNKPLKGDSLKLMLKLSKVISTGVTKILTSVPKSCDISSAVKYFTEKTLSQMANIDKTHSDKMLLECVTVISQYFSSEELVECLQYLLDLPGDVLFQDGVLSNHGALIVNLLQRILLDNDDVLIGRLPLDVVRSLVKLIESSHNLGM